MYENNIENSPFTNLSIVSWNCRGISINKNSTSCTNNSAKILHLRDLKLQDASIILLQELQTNVSILRKKMRFSVPKHLGVFSGGVVGRDGVAIFYKNEIVEMVGAQYELNPGRLVRYLFNHRNSNSMFLVYNIYNYTTSEAGEAVKLLNLLEKDILSPENRNFPALIAGDFNIDMLHTNKLSNLLIEVIHKCEFTDEGSRLLASDITWRGDGSRSKSTSRLDYIFTRNFKSQTLWNDLSLYPSISDHMILYMFMKPSNLHKNTPHFLEHCREELLSSPKVKEEIFKKILKLLYSYVNIDLLYYPRQVFDNISDCHIENRVINLLDDPVIYDEKLLASLFNKIFLIISNETSIGYKTFKNRQNRLFKKFSKKMRQFQQNKNMCTDDIVEIKSEYTTHLRELTSLHCQKKRLNRLKKSNSLSHSIFSYIRGRSKNCIYRIKDPLSGEIVNDTEKIVKIFSSEYKSKTFDQNNLQSEPMYNLDGFHELLTEFNLTEDDVFRQPSTKPRETSFTFYEIKNYLNNTKKHCSPGPSGQSRHTLLFLSSFIPNLFTAYINNLVSRGDLSASSDTKWITDRTVIFIPKKNKDSLHTSDYRPISLLESIFKMISKLLISRLEKGIFENMSSTQFGFIPGRQMSLATSTINLNIDAMLKNKLSGALISIDIKSAFDSALPSAINGCLSKLFPNNLIVDRIAKFSHVANAKISINGVLGEEIRVSQGVGQGDPSSSPKFLLLHKLFSLFIEAFLNKHNISFKKCELHKGLSSKYNPATSFADDTALLMSNRLTSELAVKLLLLYEKLHKLTGLKINPSKSQYFVIGHCETQFKSALSIIGSEVKEMTHLGVTLAEDRMRASKSSYESIIMKMKKKCKFLALGSGNIDMYTKRIIVQSLISSIPNHVYRVYTPSKNILKEIWKITRHALWSKVGEKGITSRVKIAEDKISKFYDEGGLEFYNSITSASVNMFSAFLTILEYAAKFRDTIVAANLHNDPEKFDSYIEFLNPVNFQSFMREKMSLFFPYSKHIMDYLYKLLSTVELSTFMAPFMPIFNHTLLHPLAMIKRQDFDPDGRLEKFPTIGSLMKIERSKGKCFLIPTEYNSEIDSLSPNLQVYLKKLLDDVNKKVSIKPTKFHLRFRKFSMIQMVSRFSSKFVMKALKRAAILNASTPNVPPDAWVKRKQAKMICPDLDTFKLSLFFSKTANIPPSLKSLHLEILLRTVITPNKLCNMFPERFLSNKCPRAECENRIANSDHVTYDCVFISSFIHTIRKTMTRLDIKINWCDMFYMFPTYKQTSPSLEMFVLFTYMKSFALQAAKEEHFRKWTYHNFTAKYISMLKLTTETCQMYDIPIKFANNLFIDALKNAEGILHDFLYELS